MPSWFRSRIPRPARSTTGPTSAHLWFEGVPPGPWRSASATLEVVTEPSAESLYFWALQASFTDATGTVFGAAHTGLQWNPRHPGGRAVNWGGYGRAADVSSVLDGTRSDLPGIAGDENTRNFPWTAGVGYRFTIAHGERRADGRPRAVRRRRPAQRVRRVDGDLRPVRCAIDRCPVERSDGGRRVAPRPTRRPLGPNELPRRERGVHQQRLTSGRLRLVAADERPADHQERNDPDDRLSTAPGVGVFGGERPRAPPLERREPR
jgi:hypothetical protein